MAENKDSILESWPALKEDLIGFISDTDAWIIAESGAAIARCNFLGDDQPQQIRLLDRAIELHPDRLDFSILKARWHYTIGEYDEAEAAANSVIEQEPLPVSFLAIYQPEMRRRAASTTPWAASRSTASTSSSSSTPREAWPASPGRWSCRRCGRRSRSTRRSRASRS